LLIYTPFVIHLSSKMGKKERESSDEDEPLFRSFEFNFKGWNAGGKLIFISTLIAILSLLLPWIGGDAETEIGFMQGGSIFLAFYIYPFFILAQDKSMNKIAGVISAGLALVMPGILLYYVSRDMMVRIPDIIELGFVLFMIAGIVLLIGVAKYEKYYRHGKKEKEEKRGKPCPKCNSPMEYEEEWDRWFCDECEKYRD